MAVHQAGSRRRVARKEVNPGLVLGVIGFGIAMFTLGRSSANPSQVCGPLITQRNTELLLAHQGIAPL